MNPWSVIRTALGWLLVAVGAVLVYALTRLLDGAAYRARMYVRHRRTRNIAPAPGQQWRQFTGNGWSMFEIVRIADNGRLEIQSGPVGWSDSPEEWRERVRNRRCWLERPAVGGEE